MEREKLTTKEINEKLKDLNGWTLKNEHLFRRYEFADFAASLAFVNKAGAIAEKLDHHPDITFRLGLRRIFNDDARPRRFDGFRLRAGETD